MIRVLGFFPLSYPEETLYSIVSRYKDILKLRCSTFKISLFGNKCIQWPANGIPHSTFNLLSSLPTGHRLTIEYIVSNHSLIPYYAPFLPDQYTTKLLKNKERFPSLSVLEKPTLKFCPLCEKSDKAYFGEPYWHRVHQIPGVFVCPTHNVFLVDTNLPLTGPIEHITLSQYLKHKPCFEHRVVNNDIIHLHMQNIAEDSFWLLQNIPPRKDLPDLRKEIRASFENSPWVTSKRGIDRKLFKNAFYDYYSNDFLNRINCSLDNNKIDWLNNITRDSVRQPTLSPLRFILILRFLGQTVESFFTSIRTPLPPRKPFGTGPWPCLNRVSDHYMEKTIHTVSFDKSRKDAPGKFECRLCGFIYQYRASNPNKIRVVKYGRVWEKLLLGMADASIPYRVISNELSLSPSEIGAKIRRLRSGKAQSRKVLFGSLDSLDVTRERYRDLWQSIRDKNPDMSITQIMTKYSRTYNWLKQYDLDWLNKNKPESKLLVNWEARDKEYMQIAEKAVLALLNNPQPLRMSKESIFRKMDLHPHTNLTKLPFTKKYIEKAVESCEDFALRRIRWAAQEFLKEMTIPSKNMRLVRANVKINWVQRIGYQIDEVLIMISQAIQESTKR